MKSRSQPQQSYVDNYQKINSGKRKDFAQADLIKFNRISEILTTEGSESFNHYIEWLGLSRDPKLVVLSSVHHYYYDAEEMQNVKTVVNIKELNHIKEIDNFLQSMFLILPPDCYLIGCFIDNKKQSGFSFKKREANFSSNSKTVEELNGIGSNIPFVNTIFSFLDAKPNKYLSVKYVTHLLRNNGFKVVDMTELKGLTYFCAQSQRTENN